MRENPRHGRPELLLRRVRHDGEVRSPPGKEKHHEYYVDEHQGGSLGAVAGHDLGLQKLLPNGQFTFGGTTYTTATLVPLFQSWIDAIGKVSAAQASAKDVVAALRAVEANVAPVYLGLKQDLLHTYGTQSQTLTTFGLEPRKAPAPRTAEQKATAAAKAKATRAARGTGSKKSKSTVTGNVVGITSDPDHGGTGRRHAVRTAGAGYFEHAHPGHLEVAARLVALREERRARDSGGAAVTRGAPRGPFTSSARPPSPSRDPRSPPRGSPRARRGTRPRRPPPPRA